jgi:CheY-like chemotaxis protein
VQVNEVTKVDSACEPLDVLVVDNQPLLCDALAEYLKGDWHRVTTAYNGEEALQKFSAKKFDLVITDKAMPGMNGDQLAIALRKMRADVPIILLTGFAESGISPSVTAEIDAVIGKPVSLTTLRLAIVKAIADRKEASAFADTPPPPSFHATVIEPRREAPKHFADGFRS